jgi:Domain of Unknown Function with PDB structure (DUF3857)/Transglutaminase-like superfamily
MIKVPRLTKSAALTVATLAVAFLSAPRVRADSAPDWLRAAARQALPAYADNPIAVVLLDEQQTTVQNNGEIDVRHRLAYKLLRPEAQDRYGYAAVQFDNETKVTSFKAWTITPDGHELSEGEKDAVETSMSTFEVFSDDKAKVLKFQEAIPGSVVGYEYVQKQRPFLFEDDWFFQDTIPVKQARFILQLPSGWEYSTFWINYSEQKPQVAGNRYVWDLSDVSPIDQELDMPAWRAIGGRLGIKYFPRDPAMRARTTGSWNDVGLWYDGLTESSRVASPEIKQKVAQLTAGLSDPIEKIHALTDYMQHQIRYVAINIGIGGFQPHPAADVFANQYGDCKDKVTLLSTMLHEIGIDSDYVLVNADHGEVRQDYPSMHFDHAILAILLPTGVNTTTLYASVDEPGLGRVLFFDPTDEYVPLGYLPADLQDNFCLIVTPTGGRLVRLPLLLPATNRLLRMGKFALSSKGDLSGEMQELRWGEPASDDREAFLGTEPSKRAEIIESFLGEFLNNFVLTGASLGDLNKYDENFTVNYKFVSPGYADVTGNMLVVRPRIVGDKYTSFLTLFTGKKARQYPVQFEDTTLQSDIFDITVPPGYVADGLPKPVNANCAYADYQSQTTFADGVLHYKRTFEIKGVTVPVEKLPEIRDFLQQVAADQQSAAVLKKTATP